MKPITVAITGTMGSGKSSFNKALCELGFKTMSADRIVGALCQKGQRGYLGLLQLNIEYLTDKDSNIDKNFLRELVFSDDKIRKKVEAILHPLVIEEIKLEIATLKEGEKFSVEIPLLFEIGLDKLCDYNVVVHRDQNEVFKSVSDKYNPDKFNTKKLLELQMSSGQKMIKADYIIMNDGDLETLKQKAKMFCDIIDAK